MSGLRSFVRLPSRMRLLHRVTLKPARFRTLRRFYCWFAGQHDFRAVKRSWFEDRYGSTGVTPAEGKMIYDGTPEWITGPNCALACMTCGYLRDWLDVSPATTLPEPVWIPPRYRHKPTCPLCLSRSMCWEFSRCDACGVTGEMLARAGLR